MDARNIEIQKAINHVKASREFTDKFKELFGSYPENDYYYDLMNDYIELLAKRIGDSKEGVEWFLYENGCGEEGLEAGPADGNMREIRTIEDYIWLIDSE